MARSRATVHVSIWEDSDFTALPVDAQRLYLLLLSRRDLALSGAIPFRPRLWARLAPDTDEAQIRAAVAELEAARFVLVDEDTDELLVRTLVRHDRVLTQPNVAKSMAGCWAAIVSERLREAVRLELPEHLREGFPGNLIAATPAEAGRLLRGAPPAADKPAPTSTKPPDRKGSPKGSRKGSPKGSRKGREEEVVEGGGRKLSSSRSSSPDDDDTYSNDDGSYRTPADLPTIGHGLDLDHLWPEMARRRWHLERHNGGNAPATGPRRRKWLAATAADMRAEHEHQALEHLDDIAAGTDVDALIYRLDPALALRNWQIPGPDEAAATAAKLEEWKRTAATPDEAAEAAERARQHLRRLRRGTVEA